jgi:hypothetical protein
MMLLSVIHNCNHIFLLNIIGLERTFIETKIQLSNKNVDIKFSGHDTFLE